MRILITGGAGFVGSHLADELLSRGHRVHVLDDLSTGRDRQHPAPEVEPGVRVHDRVVQQRTGRRRARRLGGRRLPPGRRGRRRADRREPGAHDREQRPHHRGRSLRRQQEEEAGLRGLDERGLRQEHGPALPRGRRPPARPDLQGPLVVRLLQGDRRVPRARLLEGARAADRHRPHVQHRRPAPDGPLRHGRPELRAPGAGRPADHRLRGRHAEPLLLPRARRRARARRR